MSPDLGVVAVLEAAGLELVAGVSLFAGHVRDDRDVPARAVFCELAEGTPPDLYLDGGAGGQVRHSRVRIRVRTEKARRAEGQDFARQVYDAVQLHPAAGFDEFECASSEPSPLGQDAAGRYLWGIDVDVTYEP